MVVQMAFLQYISPYAYDLLRKMYRWISTPAWHKSASFTAESSYIFHTTFTAWEFAFWLPYQMIAAIMHSLHNKYSTNSGITALIWNISSCLSLVRKTTYTFLYLNMVFFSCSSLIVAGKSQTENFH